MFEQFWVKFCYFNYCICKIKFYDKLPEVNIISKVTLQEQVFVSNFYLKNLFDEIDRQKSVEPISPMKWEVALIKLF
jgi:hypothetical protein